jgi:hypothetical protein
MLNFSRHGEWRSVNEEKRGEEKLKGGGNVKKG